MATQTQSSAWWIRDKKAGLESRIKAIQRLNDPTTNADELLSGAKVLLLLLLAFTGLLAGFSYYKNFSGSFPLPVAIFMAAVLAPAIEWGKNYCTTWAVRTPFFRGWQHIIISPANSFMFAGLVAIALVTFAVSAMNSTIGGRQLSVMLNQERNASPFQADTRGIDSLISNAQANINSAAATKWKGTTTRESQRAITAQTKALESLNRQRETLIAQQRDDWEAQQAIQAENRNYSANLMLKSGGWVELLQFLLILVRVACEKILDSRLPSPTPSEEPDGIGFRRRQQPAFNSDGAPNTTTPEPRRPIGFFRDREPDKPLARSEQPAVLPTVPSENAVEQSGHKEQPGTVSRAEQSNNTTSTSIIADVKEWQKRATQCFDRSMKQERKEYRQDNWERFLCFYRMLMAVGVEVKIDDAVTFVEFRHPKAYRTDEAAIAIIQEQKERLEQITKNRKAAK